MMQLASQGSRSHAPSLQHRTALVTGAASGIGLAIARELASEGARVIMSDVAEGPLQAATALVPGARAIVANLALREDVKRLAKEAGDVDLLVNNAGLQSVSPIEDFDESKWDLLVSVMLTAPFLLIRAVIPRMYERNYGRVLNIGSVHSLIASPFKSAYVAAKHGLVGLTKTVALEAAQRSGNVTINAICPSYVRTPLVEKQIADQARVQNVPEDEVLSRILLAQNAVKRLIEPEEVGKYAAFLCREEAWSITGAAITMDAGWLAH